MKWDMERLNEILEEAQDYWSYEEHFEQMIEECAELIVALQKRKRILKTRSCNRQEIDDIRSELADVIIMTAQLTKMLNENIVNDFIDRKGQKMTALIASGLK